MLGNGPKIKWTLVLPHSNGFSSGRETLTLSTLGELKNWGQLWKMSMLARKKKLGLPEKILQSLPGSRLLILANAYETSLVSNPNNIKELGPMSRLYRCCLEKKHSHHKESPTFSPPKSSKSIKTASSLILVKAPDIWVEDLQNSKV